MTGGETCLLCTNVRTPDAEGWGIVTRNPDGAYVGALCPRCTCETTGFEDIRATATDAGQPQASPEPERSGGPN